MWRQRNVETEEYGEVGWWMEMPTPYRTEQSLKLSKSCKSEESEEKKGSIESTKHLKAFYLNIPVSDSANM